jgi:hypothetical protein
VEDRRSYLSNETLIFEVSLSNIDGSPTIENIASELFRIYAPFCWRHTYGRGAGYPLSACPADNPDKSGLLCYPKCRGGYTGIGPVCWEDCGNMTTVGIFCVDSYMHIFVRKTYGRGVGVPMICSSEYEQSGALCYRPCDKKYVGVGPFCWQLCPVYQPLGCGAGCATMARDCVTAIFNMATSVLKLLYTIFGPSFINGVIVIIINSATKGDWISVAKNMAMLAKQLADAVLPYFLRKFIDWPLDTIEGATQNTSTLVTVAAFNNTDVMAPFIKFFHLDNIISAFNHGMCDLPDELDTFLN